MGSNVVLVRFKNGERREFTIDTDKVVVGRRTDCDLRIPSGDVSRQHCEIDVADNEVRIKDLGSANGTFVNGKRIAEARLAPGDKVIIGPIIFVVQIDGKPRNIKPADARVPAPAAAEKKAAQAPKTPPTTKKTKDEDVFDLSAEDFDLDDAIKELGELDEDKDMP